jgi:hypothetical protein
MLYFCEHHDWEAFLTDLGRMLKALQIALFTIF